MSRPLAATDDEGFSLVLGGPLYQLFLRTGLTQPSLSLVHRRVLASVLITWAPLVVLTAFSGTILSGAAVPFLYDLDTQVRLLFSLPLLIAAELIVHLRVRGMVEQFEEHDLISPNDQPRFAAIIAQAIRLRNSIAIEIILVLFSFTGANLFWRSQVALHVATWYGTPTDGEMALNAAGYWYAFVSLPLVRFILLRWCFRILIWYFFLGRVACLRLRLNPLHPDRAGGLGFLSNSIDAFAPVLLAQTTFLAALIGNQIWHEGATLPQFKLEIVVIVALLVVVVLLPLTFFTLQLADAKRTALRAYGLLAARYVNEFRDKWLSAGKPAEAVLGSADIQSLADLGGSYDVVREMGLLPFGRNAVLRLLILVSLPLLPLTLTMIPLEEVLDRLIKLVL